MLHRQIRAIQRDAFENSGHPLCFVKVSRFKSLKHGSWDLVCIRSDHLHDGDSYGRCKPFVVPLVLPCLDGKKKKNGEPLSDLAILILNAELRWFGNARPVFLTGPQ